MIPLYRYIEEKKALQFSVIEAFDPIKHPRLPKGVPTKGTIHAGEFTSNSREMPEPVKWKHAYKLFDLKDGKLYPTQTTRKATPLGVWLSCEAMSGRKNPLKDRFGWHGSDLPISPQQRIDKKNNGGRMDPRRVWALVRLADDPDISKELQDKADANPRGEICGELIGPGLYNHFEAGRKWMISGGIYVEKILQDEDVYEILKNSGLKDWKAHAKAEQRGAPLL